MAENNQMQLLKQKVGELAQKHRTIVTKLKGELKNSMEMASREKARSMELDRKLEDEKRRNYSLEAQKVSAPSTDVSKEIMELKSQLSAEIQKSTVLANQLKDVAMDSSNIESLKDAAYQKAAISRLESDLKSEIERSARQRGDAKEKFDSAKDQHEDEIKEILKSKEEIEKNLAGIQAEMDRIRSSSDGTSESLQLKIDDLEKEAKALNEQLENKVATNDAQAKDIEEKIAQLKELKLNLEEEIQTREEEGKNFHKLLNEQESEVIRLTKITQRFDVILMEKQMLCLKEKSQTYLKAPNQAKLRACLKEATDLKKILKRNIEHLEEFNLNTLQEVDEIENQLRNHIFVERDADQ